MLLDERTPQKSSRSEITQSIKIVPQSYQLQSGILGCIPTLRQAKPRDVMFNHTGSELSFSPKIAIFLLKSR